MQVYFKFLTLSFMQIQITLEREKWNSEA